MIATRILTVILVAGISFSGMVTAKPVTDIPNFGTIKDVRSKKKAFFDFMRPIVQAENDRVLQVRKRLIDIKDRVEVTGQAPSSGDLVFIGRVADDYGVDMSNPRAASSWSRLLAKVDTVPLRLVLAQSANESSWGTSRFARKGLNFFGQWCFKKDCGLVPLRRNKGQHHEVRVFKSVNASVAAYLRNINTGRVYSGLRTIRAKLRKKGEFVTAHQLAGGLIRYSERGQAYVKEIRAMIRVNYKLMMG